MSEFAVKRSVAAASLGTDVGSSFDMIVSLQSRHFTVERDLMFYFDSSNTHGVTAFSGTGLEDAIIFVLRGKVTIDTKVRFACDAGARAIVIVNNSEDPLGPDLDEPAPIIVGTIPYDVFEEIRKEEDQTFSIETQSNILGFAISRNIEAIRPMIEKENFLVDRVGHSVFHYAAGLDEDEKSVAVLECLLQSPLLCGINTEDCVKSSTPLHVAVHNGNIRSIYTLFQYEAEMIMRRTDGKYPIHIAAAAKQAGSLQSLLQLGVDIDSKTKDGATAIQLSSKTGCVACSRLLVQNGAYFTTCCIDKATEPAASFLRDVYKHELFDFISFRDPSHIEDIRNYVHMRMIQEMGAYLDASSLLVLPNDKAQGAFREVFVSRNQQLKSNFARTLSSMDVSGTSLNRVLQMYPPLRFLWHGCSSSIVNSILTDGFKVSYSNLSFNVYGAGIYFATDAKLASYFVTTEVQSKQPSSDKPLLPPDENGYYSLILAAVSVGTLGQRTPLMGGTETQKETMRADLKHPANRNPPVGCDSCGGKHLKEVIIYDNMLAFPVAQVKFKLKEHTRVPDPYSSDNANRSFLRSLHDVPTGVHKINLCNGVQSYLDEAPLSVHENPPLIMNWTPGTDQALNVEELYEMIGDLQTKLMLKEQENERLKIALLAVEKQDKLTY